MVWAAVRPHRLIANAVEPGVGALAAGHLDQRGVLRPEAEGVVRKRAGCGRRAFTSFCVACDALRGGCPAVPGKASNVATEVEMANLVREGDVVGVGGPDHAGLLRAGAIHRMEVLRDELAALAVRRVARRSEAVSRAGRHRAAPTGG